MKIVSAMSAMEMSGPRRESLVRRRKRGIEIAMDTAKMPTAKNATPPMMPGEVPEKNARYANVAMKTKMVALLAPEAAASWACQKFRV
jgi:hypothetical protein